MIKPELLMKNTLHALMSSVAAAALIAGVSAASAQAPTRPGTPAAQQSGASDTMAPPQKPKDGAKVGESGMKNGQAGQSSKGANSETMAPAKRNSEMKADPQPKGEAKTDVKAETRPDAKIPESSGSAKVSATGSGAAGGPATLSSEQRSSVRASVRQQNAKPATNINFSISVGTQVPRTVHFYRVPTQLVAIYPHWRGYDYFLVGDQIIVVNPRNHQIVAVLEA
jgi:hypothetical protein